MSKKFGKFLLFSALAGAAAYGAYTYMQKKEQTASAAGHDDADDDFDDFSEDLDEEPAQAKTRSYVSLNLDKAEAIATEAFHKAKEVITDSVNQVRETVKSVTEGQCSSETNFTDLTALQKETEAQAEQSASDNAQDTADASAQTTDTIDADSQQSAEENAKGTAAGKESSDSEKKTAPAGQVEEFFDDTP